MSRRINLDDIVIIKGIGKWPNPDYGEWSQNLERFIGALGVIAGTSSPYEVRKYQFPPYHWVAIAPFEEHRKFLNLDSSEFEVIDHIKGICW